MRADLTDAVQERRLVCGLSADSSVLSDKFHAPMRELFQYWTAGRAGSAAFDRRSLDPTDIPGLLANIFLIDLVETEPFDIAFRLVGTAVVEVEGEITGRRLSELIPRHPDVETLWNHYERVFRGEICLRRQTLVWQGRDHISYDVLLLPMTRGGDGVDSALGMAIYDVPNNRPRWIARH